ncbi:MAG: YlxR family protein [Eubacterium sp.]|nr:YlxR family protein [Eubacterium sp.]
MKTKKIPMRKCVGCQERKEKKELIRVLRTPEGAVVLDTTGRANGRGAYLCRSAGCLQKAVRNKGLARSLEQEIPAEVLEALQKEMEALEDA